MLNFHFPWTKCTQNSIDTNIRQGFGHPKKCTFSPRVPLGGGTPLCWSSGWSSAPRSLSYESVTTIPICRLHTKHIRGESIPSPHGSWHCHWMVFWLASQSPTLYQLSYRGSYISQTFFRLTKNHTATSLRTSKTQGFKGSVGWCDSVEHRGLRSRRAMVQLMMDFQHKL